jgi:hypothetical protein
MDTYFGPLSKDYCIYFYILSIIAGVTFALSAISIFSYTLINFKKINSMFVVNSILVLFNTFLAYIANRLLNTMCVKAL